MMHATLLEALVLIFQALYETAAGPIRVCCPVVSVDDGFAKKAAVFNKKVSDGDGSPQWKTCVEMAAHDFGAEFEKRIPVVNFKIIGELTPEQYGIGKCAPAAPKRPHCRPRKISLTSGPAASAPGLPNHASQP
jgi:hypothetical protein